MRRSPTARKAPASKSYLASLSFRELLSIQVDEQRYGTDGKMAHCRYALLVRHQFSRPVVSINGEAISVDEVRSGLPTVRSPGRRYTLDSYIRSTLEFICIPSSIKMLPFNCFSDCDDLRTVAFESDSSLSRIDSYAFEQSGKLSSICIPSSVEQICSHCFYDCSSLSLVTFETCSKLSGIEEGAFSWCRALSTICIPPAVEAIGPECFLHCHRLSTVTFESGSKLSYIDGSAFRNCSALSCICIPPSLQELISRWATQLLIVVTEDRNDEADVDGSDEGTSE
jgi:predicted metal-binding protein